MKTGYAFLCALLLLLALPACHKLHTYTCTCTDTRGNVLEQTHIEASTTKDAKEPCLKQQDKWNNTSAMYKGTICTIGQ